MTKGANWNNITAKRCKFEYPTHLVVGLGLAVVGKKYIVNKTLDLSKFTKI